MSNRKAVDQFNAFDVLDQADEDGNMDAWEEVAPKKTAAARKAASASQGKSAAGIKNRAGTASQPATDALTGVNSKQGSAGDKAPVDDYYRAFEHVYRDPATNDVILRFHKTNVLRIRPNGEVTLTTGGWYTYTTLAAINDGMQAMNMRVLHHGQPAAGVWSVKDDQGRNLPFQDGMVLQPTRPEHRKRADTVLRAYHGGAEVPRYAHRQQPASQQQQQQLLQQQGQAAMAVIDKQQAAMSAHQVAGSVVAGNESGASINNVAWGPTLQQQQRQQQLSPVQQPAALLKPAHLQLAEAVQQLGMEDEIFCDDDRLCVVCLENQRNEILVPCGHMVLCQACCQSVMNSSNACPVCREIITEHCTLDPHHH